MDLMADAVTTHIYAIYFFLAIMLFNAFIVFNSTTENFIKTVKKLKIMTPLYHVTNASVVYTGSIVAAYSHDMRFIVILMIATSILLMILEIKRYKKMRVIRTYEKELQEDFFIFAKKIYMAEIIILTITFTISKLL